MDFENITLGEIAEIEDYAKMSFSEIGDDKPGVYRLRIGLAWIMKRRIDPTFTIKQAEGLTPTELTDLFGADEPDAVKK
jgi:hypothetical protein